MKIVDLQGDTISSFQARIPSWYYFGGRGHSDMDGV